MDGKVAALENTAVTGTFSHTEELVLVATTSGPVK
jgi:hypothetical protein